MPRLTEDGLILFQSSEELLSEYDNNLKNSGLFVRSEVSLPLRERRPFTLCIEGSSTRLEVTAEVVFTAGDRVGLQVHFDAMTERALAAIIQGLRDHSGTDTPVAPSAALPAWRAFGLRVCGR